MKRLQFVWWGWRNLQPLIYFARLREEMNMGKIYRWVLYLGPMEIRRWAEPTGEVKHG